MSRSARTRFYLTLGIILILALILNCGPSGGGAGKETASSKVCAPENLTVKPNDHTLSLRWDSECPDDVILAGYNIYLSDFSLAEFAGKKLPDSIKPFNSAPYPGDTDPEDAFETMEIGNLENGIPFYVSIRTVYPDYTESSASNEVLAYCRPEGEFVLDLRYSDDDDGFDFSEGKHVRADAGDNDIYFYRAGSTDFIASPHRLNGYNRTSYFYSLGKTKDIYQYPELDLDFEPVNKMPIREGESYLIKTADNNFAKVRVEKLFGMDRDRKIKLTYIFQPTPDLTRF